jgi:poly(3-hydroxybutyrate) depolymerase
MMHSSMVIALRCILPLVLSAAACSDQGGESPGLPSSTSGAGGTSGPPSGPTVGGGGSGNGGNSERPEGGPSETRDASLDVVPVDATDATDAIVHLDAREDAVGDGPSSARQSARPLGTTAASLGFYEYLPAGYGDGGKRPVLFFFHGVGENGNGSADLSKVLAHGPPKVIAMNQWPPSRPFVVLSPQHRPVGGQTDPVYGGFDCWTPTEIHDFIAFGIAHYDIDTRRVYLTGLSCGAMGTENYFKQFDGQQGIAATALISGNMNIVWPTQGCALVGQMGLWDFHGDADTTVPIAGDNAAMPQLMACPAPRKEVKYTVYPGVEHDAWTRTYDLSSGNDIYTWLLGFSR